MRRHCSSISRAAYGGLAMIDRKNEESPPHGFGIRHHDENLWQIRGVEIEVYIFQDIDTSCCFLCNSNIPVHMRIITLKKGKNVSVPTWEVQPIIRCQENLSKAGNVPKPVATPPLLGSCLPHIASMAMAAPQISYHWAESAGPCVLTTKLHLRLTMRYLVTPYFHDPGMQSLGLHTGVHECLREHLINVRFSSTSEYFHITVVGHL